MIRNGKITGTTSFLILLICLLLLLNASFGILLTRQAGSALVELMQTRMLDIANTAAGMLDGDTLESITPADEGTSAYESIMHTLSGFQGNTDLWYIYCIRDMGDGSFVFGLDPSPEDPGEFCSPVVRTPALEEAARGTAAVDKVPYEDAWGVFYSAYSPVFDSAGHVAGIVAADFSAEWYESQLSTLKRTTVIVGAASMAAGGAVVAVLTARGRRRLRTVHRQLNALAGNIEELTNAIGNIAPLSEQPARTEPARYRGEDVDALGEKILIMQEELRTQIARIHEQAYLDGSTGVRSKAAYLDTVKNLEQRIEEKTAAFSVAVFDLNGLKEINDTCGHECGDLALADAAGALKKAFGSEAVYRIGGDEFIAVLQTASEAGITGCFAQLDDAIAEVNRTERRYRLPLGLSRGYAVCTAEDEDYLTVFRRADRMMYGDKAAYYRTHGDRRKSNGAFFATAAPAQETGATAAAH